MPRTIGWQAKHCEAIYCGIMLRQKGLTANAREAVLQDAGGNVAGMSAKFAGRVKQPGLGIVDGDDGGALRAALIVGCLRYRLT